MSSSRRVEIASLAKRGSSEVGDVAISTWRKSGPARGSGFAHAAKATAQTSATAKAAARAQAASRPPRTSVSIHLLGLIRNMANNSRRRDYRGSFGTYADGASMMMGARFFDGCSPSDTSQREDARWPLNG